MLSARQKAFMAHLQMVHLINEAREDHVAAYSVAWPTPPSATAFPF